MNLSIQKAVNYQAYEKLIQECREREQAGNGKPDFNPRFHPNHICHGCTTEINAPVQKGKFFYPCTGDGFLIMSNDYMQYLKNSEMELLQFGETPKRDEMVIPELATPPLTMQYINGASVVTPCPQRSGSATEWRKYITNELGVSGHEKLNARQEEILAGATGKNFFLKTSGDVGVRNIVFEMAKNMDRNYVRYYFGNGLRDIIFDIAKGNADTKIDEWRGSLFWIDAQNAGGTDSFVSNFLTLIANSKKKSKNALRIFISSTHSPGDLSLLLAGNGPKQSGLYSELSAMTQGELTKNTMGIIS